MDVILHNRPEGTPSDNEFVAYGTPTTPSGQIKMSNFYALLMTKLGFFKVENLLSEIFGNLTSMASARANLSVPSVSEMTTADNLRAEKTNVIEKNSTIAYTPTVGTHPVNKKYVNENIRGGEVIFPTLGQGQSYMIIPISPPFADTNYAATVTVKGTDAGFPAYNPPIVDNFAVNQFVIKITRLEAGVVNDYRLSWVLVKF